MTVLESIEALLHEARVARHAGQTKQTAEHLERAHKSALPLRADHPLRLRVAWKLAKFRHDADADPGALEALRLLIEAEADLFSAYPRGLKGAIDAARRHQDTRGYASDLLPMLWSARLQASKDADDEAGSARTRLDRAWCYMVRKEDKQASQDLHILSNHPDQDVQCATAYTILCDANWRLDQKAATFAHSTLMDHIDRSLSPPHIEEALFEAALRFGFPSPDTHRDTPYLRALQRRTGFEGIPETMRQRGPEFFLAARQSAWLCGQAAPPEQRWGCVVFRFHTEHAPKSTIVG